MKKSFRLLFNQKKSGSEIVAASKELENKFEELGIVESNGLFTYDDSIQSEIDKIFSSPKYQSYFKALKM